MELPDQEMENALIWVDAQTSPAIAKWLGENLPAKAVSVRSPGLRDADDLVIFEQARQANAIILTKDIDLVKIQERREQPPKIIHLTCGNTSNQAIRIILQKHFEFIMDVLLRRDEPFIEITG